MQVVIYLALLRDQKALKQFHSYMSSNRFLLPLLLLVEVELAECFSFHYYQRSLKLLEGHKVSSHFEGHSSQEKDLHLLEINYFDLQL